MSLGIAILFIAIAVIAYSWDTARGQNMDIIEYHCQDQSHAPNSEARRACDKVYDYLRIHGADRGYNATTHVNVGNYDYYRHAACDGNLFQDQCYKCIESAHEFAITECMFSNGAQVKYQSCRFRVEDYAFNSNW